MSNNSNLEDDELDLGELLAALWSHKILIILFTGLSIFLAGYLAFTAEKKFTAKSIFQIQQNDGGSRFNMPGELGTLASLAGFGGAQATTSSDVLIERGAVAEKGGGGKLRTSATGMP